MTREQWLINLTEALRPHFKDKGFEIPEANKLRMSCGWPSVRALSKKKRVIGECWNHTTCADGSFQIFISPVLQDSAQVVATHIHELGHAIVGTEHGHKRPFKKFCDVMQLAGKPTATIASPELEAYIQTLLPALGEYPNSTLDSLTLERPGGKKQGTRMVKIECPNDECGYTARTTKKWIAKGLPTCPCGAVMECPDGLLEDDGEGEGEGEGEDS